MGNQSYLINIFLLIPPNCIISLFIKTGKDNNFFIFLSGVMRNESTSWRPGY